MKVKHDLSGHCPKCQEIFNRYPGFYLELRVWFEKLQQAHPEAHISCAGRGEAEQTKAFLTKRSMAKWGASAHNWNAAIDVFCSNRSDLYDLQWFHEVIAPNLNDSLTWYGQEDARFYELPHIQQKDWVKLAEDGILKLISLPLQ